MVRGAAALAILVALVLPATARANGDPASDYLLVQSIFLPFNAKVDAGTQSKLVDTIRAADKAKFKIKVAVIGSRYDLGTAFSLFNQAQRYSEFLGLELSFQYRDRLLVVMPNGYGFTIDGKADPAGVGVVKSLPAPGQDATKQVEGATAAIRKLATASGIALPASGGGRSSSTRDRIVIAAASLAFAALLAAIVFWRRGGRSPAQA